MASDLTGRVAVVTGAARGIGQTIAAHLAAAGARVVLTDLRDEVEATAAALASSGICVVVQSWPSRAEWPALVDRALGADRGRWSALRAEGAAARAAEVLAEHRASIDRLDAVLVFTLAERFKHTQSVGRLKAQHDLPPSDPAREAQQIARLERLAAEADLDPAFARKFLNFVISEVIRHHEQFQK